MAIFAILDKNNIVKNRIDSENAELIYTALGADTILVQETEVTGASYIGSKLLDSGKFEPFKVFASWLWDSKVEDWISPIPFPTDGKPYYWDEATLSWIEITPPVEETPIA